MKKLFLSFVAIAAMVFASSCQQEKMEAELQGGSTVTYTVEIPELIGTRAVGDEANMINDLVYAVYVTDAENLEEVQADWSKATKLYDFNSTAKRFENGTDVVSFELLNNKNHIVLLWAQNADTWVIGETFDLTSISYPNNMEVNKDNADKYAAFYAVKFIPKTERAKTSPIVLTRPFAQINVATLDPDKYDVTIESTTIKVKDAGNVFNVAKERAVQDDFDVTYNWTSKVTGNAFKNCDHYVAMNYVFVTDTDVVEVDYTINTNKGDDIKGTISNVPIKKNYRTNIIGNLLTGNVKYDITLDRGWGTPENNIVMVTEASDIQQAIENAEPGVDTEIKLDGDINLNDLFASLLTRAGATEPQFITIPAGVSITLDLNGYTLTGVDETEKSFGLITNKGNLTIINSANKVGKINLSAKHNNGWNRYSSVISTQPGSTLTVGARVEIEHLGGTDMAYGVDVLTNGVGTTVYAVIDGATIKSKYRAIRQFLNGTEATNSLIVKAGSTITSTSGNKSIWMQDPSKNANSGSLVVEEGAKLMTDAYLEVTEGSTEWPVSVSIAASALLGEATVRSENVPAGYKVECKEGVWTVEFSPVAKIGEKEYGSLRAAVAAVEDGGTITLIADETFTETNRTLYSGDYYVGLNCVSDKSFTIDLGGKAIRNANGAVDQCIFYFKNDGEKANVVTLKNGTIDAGSAYNVLKTSTSNGQKITLNVENVTLVGQKSDGAVCMIRGGAELNVKAGTIITGNDNYTGIEAVGNNTVVNIYEGAEIYQNGTSSYVGAIVGASYNATLNIYGGKGASKSCGIIVMTTGGTVNVSGGDWTSNRDGSVSNNNKGVLVSQNSRWESGRASKSIINVTGGTFKGGYNCYCDGPGVEADDAQINISGGNFNADPTDYIADGSEIQTGTTFTVVEQANVSVGNTTYGSLNRAFKNAQNGETITLLQDMENSNTAVLPAGKNVTLDLSKFTLKGTMHKSVGAVIENNGTLTIKNGTISSTADNGGSAVMNNGTLKIEDATLNGAPNAGGSWPSYTVNNTAVMTANNTKFTSYHGSLSSYGEGAEATLNNCEIDMVGIPGFTSHGIYTYNGGKVVVNGGTYANKATDQASSGASVINGAVEVNAGTFTGRIENYYGTPVLKGGTYSVKPNERFIASEYKIVTIKDNEYEVIPVNDYIDCITNPDDVTYSGNFFENPINDALYFKDCNFKGDATINVTRTYGAIVLEKCSADINGDLITINNENNSVMALQNLNLTLKEGKKLIKSTKPIYQVFMSNITINGVQMTDANIGQYLENVAWFQVVEEI